MPTAALAPADPFTVDVRGETVSIPTRIYHPEPTADVELTGTQRLVLHCLYSRHHDGKVRQRHVEQILVSSEPWVVPFVVQLLGEYVLEIVLSIAKGLPAHSAQLYGEFIVANPAFFARTQRRVVSYWDCYYRRQYPVFRSYPGCVLAEAFLAAASEQAGATWPRHLPRASGPRFPA